MPPTSLRLQALGLVERLHLGDQLGVGALRLDDGDDRQLPRRAEFRASSRCGRCL